MIPALIARIQSFTLTARATLERETEEQLQGLYGWLPDGSFGKGTALSLPEAAETRRLLETYVAEEAEAGVDAAKAREKLKRETAFTWLNRAVAFRMMEERGIIRATLGKLHKSNAFIYWLTDVKGEASIPPSTPVNAMGEGPVDAAYREFLLWQCGQLAAEVSVLFDPATLASRLCPRPAVLKELVESMNAADLAESWQAGNEETIGWIYEGFIEDENTLVFEKFGKGKKVLAEEIGAATQRFTPRWIVRYLIENSIGRIWAEIHPDSQLAVSLEYLVPLKSATKRPLKPVKDITFLDPCCGSMHFGLLAFDLFAGMYREERENAGKPGWPDNPSAATEEEIPELILAHNIHGIDIDLRAVQVSALALLLKARTLNPKAEVTDRNLATANIEQLTGGRLDAFISATPFSHPIYERVLRRLASRLKDSNHLGSLLRIEDEIEQLVNAERRQSTDLFEQLPGFDREQFTTQEGMEEFFGILTDQIGRHLDHFVQASGGGLFASEAAKGLRFLRLVERRYDVVATNPPYMSRRNMSDVMSTYLDGSFKSSKGDLYAACITRCAELVDPLGLVAMVTQQSFMFISSYEDMRADLRKTSVIETMAHLGPRAFPNIAGEKVNTTAFVLRQEPEVSRRESQAGTYFRLVRERDADSKRLAFVSALTALRQGDDHPQLFLYQQSDFDAVPGKPFAYWLTESLRTVFRSPRSFKDIADWKRGLATGENPRFIRFQWEIARSDRREKWFPYVKGGKALRWHGNEFFLVNWERDGREIRNLFKNGKLASRPQNTDYYFREGLTYGSVSTSGFTARFMERGHAFDQASNSIFPSDCDADFLLAYLNSVFSSWVLSLNPTVNILKDDLERIPICCVDSDKLAKLAKEAVELAKKLAGFKETEGVFSGPPKDPNSSREAIRQNISEVENRIDQEIFSALGLGDQDQGLMREAIELGLSGDPEAENEPGEEEDDDEETSDLSPADWARSWVSYALGTVLGRFEIGKVGGLGCGDFPEATVNGIRKLIDPDGIMPCEEGHKQDIAARAFACLELMLGAAEARERVRLATDTEGGPVEALRGWLDRFTGTPAASFWKYHHQLYRKRPIFWPFQSPNKTYTIWVFHEKIGPNTLHTLRDFVTERLNLLEREITDLRPKAAKSKDKERELQKLEEMGDDLREFATHLKAHIDAGYQSCIDDGVVLNAAPLHDLLPSWKETGTSPNDPAKAWKALEAGKFDWAQQAMRYWPERVTEACRTNRSFAIAHGLEHLCTADPSTKKKGRAAKGNS
jgi:type I restriction-modification system DNA methylase subunit